MWVFGTSLLRACGVMCPACALVGVITFGVGLALLPPREGLEQSSLHHTTKCVC
jgi:hypothetical protein